MAMAREISRGQATTRIYRGLKRRSFAVKTLRLALPLILVGMVGLWAAQHYFASRLASQLGIIGDLIIELDPDKVTLVAPTVRGYMANGTHYVLTAQSIKRGLVTGSPVELQNLDIDLAYLDGTAAHLSSEQAELDMENAIITALDQLSYANEAGMRGEFGHTIINQRQNSLHTEEPFTVVTANGSTINASHLEVNMTTGIWVLSDVRMLFIRPTEPQ